MARIKELEDVLKLVDAMPRENQLACVQYLKPADLRSGYLPSHCSRPPPAPSIESLLR